MIYTAFTGVYLSSLEYEEDFYYTEIERLLTVNVTNYLIQKQQQAQKRLGLSFIDKQKVK